MDAAWIGVAGGLSGVLLGSVLTEAFRRSQRIEAYAPKVFEKRLQIYEELFHKMVEGQTVAGEVMEVGKHNQNERHALISTVVLDLAAYCDKNGFYLSEELTLHCTGTFMGAEEVADIKDPHEREEAAGRVRRDAGNAIRMLRGEAGVERINRYFGKVTRAKLSSPMIEEYRRLSKEAGHPGF